MSFSPRFAFLVIAVLIFAACSSGDEFASEASVVVEANSSDTSIEAETEAVTEVEVVADAEEVATPETTTTTAPPAAPEPATASTVFETTSDDFPDIIAAQATPDGDETWRFDVTVSSTYDTPQRYADGWRVVGPDGTEYGFRLLTHDHASEQPFTRSQSGIAIPADVDTVTIEGRDLANGFGGGVLEIDLR